MQVETVVLLSSRVTGRDVYGNDVYGETETVVSGFAAAWPGFAIQGGDTSTEAGGNRSTTITGLTVWLPADVTVTAQDRMRIRGQVWEVDADPAVWVSPYTGRTPGQQVVLRKVVG